jgi:anti-anti-sigma factor
MAAQLQPRSLGTGVFGDVAAAPLPGGTAVAEPADFRSAVERFERLTLGPSPNEFVLDFHGIELMSSDSLVALVRLRRNLQAAGKRLTLCNLSAPVAEIFAVTGLGRLFAIRPGPTEA